MNFFPSKRGFPHNNSLCFKRAYSYSLMVSYQMHLNGQNGVWAMSWGCDMSFAGEGQGDGLEAVSPG